MIFKYNSLTDRLSKEETISHIIRCFETLRVEYQSTVEDSILATHFGKEADTDLYITRNEVMETGPEGEPIDILLAEISVKRGSEELYSNTYMLEYESDFRSVLETLWEKEYVIELEDEQER